VTTPFCRGISPLLIAWNSVVVDDDDNEDDDDDDDDEDNGEILKMFNRGT